MKIGEREGGRRNSLSGGMAGMLVVFRRLIVFSMGWKRQSGTPIKKLSSPGWMK